MSKQEDLTGKVFGLLRVIEPADIIIKSRNAFWKCECICGNTIYVSYTGLVQGAYTSCGCDPKDEK
jgi:hypothetical protein